MELADDPVIGLLKFQLVHRISPHACGLGRVKAQTYSHGHLRRENPWHRPMMATTVNLKATQVASWIATSDVNMCVSMLCSGGRARRVP